MQWYFLNPQGEQVAIDESQFPILVQQGVIQRDTMVWREGMTDWLPAEHARSDLFAASPAPAMHRVAPAPALVPVTPQAGPAPAQTHAIPHQQPMPQQAAPDLSGFVRHTSQPLYQCKGWMRFLAVLHFLSFLAIIPIFLGIKLWQAADDLERAGATGHPQYLDSANRNLGSYFKLMGIMVIVMVGLSILLNILLLAGAIAISSNA